MNIWEILLSYKLGKLKLTDSNIDSLANLSSLTDLQELSLSTSHLVTFQEIDFKYNDPFDNILISQAIAEDLTLLTVDRNILDQGLAKTC
ncbi:type II toxin-antitoxin system VapC family toxin [Candidatus Saccharibacteria bacterium]|nr:type II toxin-antitoxin system VapC family toxin [Candidatus Saccharibacteria bacterium]MCB9834520.1 type II toxin-antitoxin system VapC family toxin [Candidatus Nomurabacteria bacterium]